MGGWQGIRGLGAAAGGVVASLVLAACSGDSPDPQPDPSEPSEPSSSQTPTDDPTEEPTEPEVPELVEPELPEAATEPTRKGAEAFVEYYLNVLNYAKTTGDASPIRRASSRCGGCEKYAGLYTTTYAKGGYFRGMDWSVETLSVVKAQPGFFALVKVRSTAGRHAETAESESKRYPAGSFEVRFRVQNAVDAWNMTEIVAI